MTEKKTAGTKSGARARGGKAVAESEGSTKAAVAEAPRKGKKSETTAKSGSKAGADSKTKSRTKASKTAGKSRTKAKTGSKTAGKGKAGSSTKSKSGKTGARKPAPSAHIVEPLEPKVEEAGERNFKPYSLSEGEEYMNEAQRAHFRQMLLDWKHQLMEEVDRTMSHMQNEASHLADPSDQATLEEEFSLELRTRDRERKLIKKIDATIELIDSDQYGFCESCGVEIGIRRLEARPTASQCIDCKTIDEMKERRSVG